MLKRLLNTTIYVKVYRNSFVLRDIHNNNEIALSANEAFTTTRLLIGDFNRAEALLKEGISKLVRKSWLTAAPSIVMHPMAMTEGGLAPVEERILRELAAAVGSRKVVVWDGNELSDAEVMQAQKQA